MVADLACPVVRHGTFGEILQGYINDGIDGLSHFLYTAPINELQVRAEFELTSGPDGFVSVEPGDRRLALSGFQALASRFGVRLPAGVLRLTSNIPVGKGHASSTADITAACELLFREFRADVPEPERRSAILSVAAELEYGDYVMHPGIASCRQRRQELITAYSSDLRWVILGVDEGGEVPTGEFHRRQTEDPRLAKRYGHLFQSLDVAIRENDYAAAAEVATESAVIHDRVLPKTLLPTMRSIGARCGALGICVAHSGTLIGLIFSQHQPDYADCLARARESLRRCAPEPAVYTLRESVHAT